MTGVRRIVVVGAGLAALRSAEALRIKGFDGSLVVVGDERHPPYDRPPLSKQVALGMIRADHVALPHAAILDVDWRLGQRATALDTRAREITLGGERLGFDRLLIATGSRARQWPHAEQAALTGVLTLRTIEDAAMLREALAARPTRTVVIGGGFTGCELASACRALGLAVTLIEHNATPLASALGLYVGQGLSNICSVNSRS